MCVCCIQHSTRKRSRWAFSLSLYNNINNNNNNKNNNDNNDTASAEARRKEKEEASDSNEAGSISSNSRRLDEEAKLKRISQTAKEVEREEEVEREKRAASVLVYHMVPKGMSEDEQLRAAIEASMEGASAAAAAAADDSGQNLQGGGGGRGDAPIWIDSDDDKATDDECIIVG